MLIIEVKFLRIILDGSLSRLVTAYKGKVLAKKNNKPEQIQNDGSRVSLTGSANLNNSKK